MPRRSWATPEQLLFLNENVPGYEAAQESQRTSNFLVGFMDGFFEKFSSTDGDRVQLRKVSKCLQ